MKPVLHTHLSKTSLVRRAKNTGLILSSIFASIGKKIKKLRFILSSILMSSLLLLTACTDSDMNAQDNNSNNTENVAPISASATNNVAPVSNNLTVAATPVVASSNNSQNNMANTGTNTVNQYPTATAPTEQNLKITVFDVANNSLSKDETSITLVDDEDVGKNGVRDEIEEYIAQLNWKPEQKRASFQMAKAFQATLVAPKISAQDAAPLANKVDAAVACVFSKILDNASNDSPPVRAIDDILKMTLNTENRKMAYKEYVRVAGSYRITIDETQCI